MTPSSAVMWPRRRSRMSFGTSSRVAIQRAIWCTAKAVWRARRSRSSLLSCMWRALLGGSDRKPSTAFGFSPLAEVGPEEGDHLAHRLVETGDVDVEVAARDSDQLLGLAGAG